MICGDIGYSGQQGLGGGTQNIVTVLLIESTHSINSTKQFYWNVVLLAEPSNTVSVLFLQQGVEESWGLILPHGVLELGSTTTMRVVPSRPGGEAVVDN